MITKDDFSALPMPDSVEVAFLNRELSAVEYNALQRGFSPRDMDDRWFMYLQDGWLYLHRSWTGHCIFKVEIDCVEGVYTLTQLYVNRDSKQYKSTNMEADKSELNSILSWLILVNLKGRVRRY